jgi:hypothetical protein
MAIFLHNPQRFILVRAADGQKKTFPTKKGKAQRTKKGNNEPMAKPDANRFFSFTRVAPACMTSFLFSFRILS